MTSSWHSAPVIGTSGWLIWAAQQGDRAAQHELVRRYEPLVRGVLHRLRLPADCEREDLAQEARIGLWAAVRSWRPERGPFPAFASRCVRNHALMALEAACARKHRVLTYATPLEHGGDATPHREWAPTLLDTLSGPVDAGTDPEARLLVREQLAGVLRALPTLSEKQQAAISGALNGRTHEQLAVALGGTRKAASHAVERARRKLAAAAMPDAA